MTDGEWVAKDKINNVQSPLYVDLKQETHKITRTHWFDRRIVRKQIDIMPTYHYVQSQGKLMIKRPADGQKPQFGKFFAEFEVKYLQIANFSEK